MEVRHRQQLGATRGEPTLFRQRLALGAMAVTAGMVAYGDAATGVTLSHGGAQRWRAATRDRAQRTVLRHTQAVRLRVLPGYRAYDVGQFNPCPRRLRGSAHGLKISRRGLHQQIQR